MFDQFDMHERCGYACLYPGSVLCSVLRHEEEALFLEQHRRERGYTLVRMEIPVGLSWYSTTTTSNIDRVDALTYLPAS